MIRIASDLYKFNNSLAIGKERKFVRPVGRKIRRVKKREKAVSCCCCHPVSHQVDLVSLSLSLSPSFHSLFSTISTTPLPLPSFSYSSPAFARLPTRPYVRVHSAPLVRMSYIRSTCWSSALPLLWLHSELCTDCSCRASGVWRRTSMQQLNEVKS